MLVLADLQNAEGQERMLRRIDSDGLKQWPRHGGIH
jgi:hypothetical protein